MKERPSLLTRFVVRPLSVIALFGWVFFGGFFSSQQKETKVAKKIINISPAQADLTLQSAYSNLELGFTGSIGQIGGGAGCSAGSCCSSCCSSCA